MDEAALKPVPQIQKVIDLLNGTWDLAITYEPTEYNPDGGTVTGREISRPGPGGFSLIFQTDSKDSNDFAALGIIEWSPAEKAYSLHWLNSLSPTGAYFKGSWEGEDLVFNGKESMMGPELASRHSITKIKPGAFTYTIDMGPSPDELKRVITIEYTKAK